jgi:hypothetical protein
MIVARTTNGARVSFILRTSDNGSLAAGIAAFAFTITVVAPDMTTTAALTVAESTGKPGLYYADIASSFFTTNGTGVYGVTIEVANVASTPAVYDAAYRGIQVHVNDIDNTFNLGQAVLGNVV